MPYVSDVIWDIWAKCNGQWVEWRYDHGADCLSFPACQAAGRRPRTAGLMTKPRHCRTCGRHTRPYVFAGSIDHCDECGSTYRVRRRYCGECGELTEPLP